ncbi:hypothetical protein S7335_5155 [Synechococcus sp. PCC 7335]|nr:hypothetical protein S7335_5155 [Synechococcus sp. PCC 7335]
MVSDTISNVASPHTSNVRRMLVIGCCGEVLAYVVSIYTFSIYTY